MRNKIQEIISKYSVTNEKVRRVMELTEKRHELIIKYYSCDYDNVIVLMGQITEIQRELSNTKL